MRATVGLLLFIHLSLPNIIVAESDRPSDEPKPEIRVRLEAGDSSTGCRRRSHLS